MRIIINLDVMLARRKMTLTELEKKVKINLSNLSAFRSNKVRGLRLDTLAQICGALHCQPGDILECITDVEYEDLLGYRNHGDSDDQK